MPRWAVLACGAIEVPLFVGLLICLASAWGAGVAVGFVVSLIVGAIIGTIGYVLVDLWRNG